MLQNMSYLDKVKKLFGGKLPKSFFIHMNALEFNQNEKEAAAKDFFQSVILFPERRQKAKELGLI